MDRHIHLRDLGQFEPDTRSLNIHFRPKSIKDARAALVARDLRFDNETGVISDNTGILEKLKYPDQFEPLPDLESVFRWHFNRYIRNAASRIERGLEP